MYIHIEVEKYHRTRLCESLRKSENSFRAILPFGAFDWLLFQQIIAFQISTKALNDLVVTLHNISLGEVRHVRPQLA